MNTHKQARFATLSRKFTAITEILAALKWEGADAPTDDVVVNVERVDRNMLTNTAALCSGEKTSLCQEDRPNQLGWQYESYFAVGSDHKILGRMGALEPKSSARDSRQLKHLVQEHGGELVYLVRVTVTGWCERLDDWLGKDSPLGKLISRDIQVTVYRAPDEGFSALLKTVWTDANLRLHFRNSLDAPGSSPDVDAFITRLIPVVRRFQDAVFYDGFKDQLAKQKGYLRRGTLGDVTYEGQVWENGAKCDVRFTRGGVFLGFFSNSNWAETGKNANLTLSAINATVCEARQMLNDLEGAWQKQHQERLRAELKDLFESAVEVTLIYYLRKADPDLDLEAAVPGLKIVAREGDLYVVHVPKASHAALQALEDQGKLPNPTAQECQRLEVLAKAASKQD